MQFLTGVNYWASNLGLHTWRKFDAKVVDKDFEYLASYGVNTVRVFPSWDVFQPLSDSYSKNDTFRLRIGETPVEYTKYPNSGLSVSALNNFKTLLKLAKKHNLKVIVALVTGWMSGKRFMPDAIKHLNPITDAKAINFECRFIKDFVTATKYSKQIIAWELGNECNAMSLESDEAINELWLSTVSNAIRTADPTRPVYAGMHGLTANGKWKLETLGYYTDMQTTHPYPLFTPYCSKDELTAMRSSLHAAAESQYYASISKTPCLVEEAGSLGPMIISGEKEAEYLEKAYATSFASGTTGFLWWCSFDQDNFDFAPYDVFAVEQNLGISKADRTPKPTLIKMKEMAEFASLVGDLPSPVVDGTVILTNNQDEWKTAYGAYSMAIQAGLNVDFIYENQKLPDRSFYILPSITEILGLPKILLADLVKRVKNGAKLLISYNGGYVGRFEEISGLTVEGRSEQPIIKELFGTYVNCPTTLYLKPSTAKILLADENGNALLSENEYGNGKVYFLNAPIEYAYTDLFHPEDSELYKVYKTLFNENKAVVIDDKKVAVYRYEGGKAMVINFSNNTEFKVHGIEITRTVNASVNEGVIKLEKNYAYIEFKEN